MPRHATMSPGLSVSFATTSSIFSFPTGLFPQNAVHRPHQKSQAHRYRVCHSTIWHVGTCRTSPSLRHRMSTDSHPSTWRPRLRSSCPPKSNQEGSVQASEQELSRVDLSRQTDAPTPGGLPRFRTARFGTSQKRGTARYYDILRRSDEYAPCRCGSPRSFSRGPLWHEDHSPVAEGFARPSRSV